MAAAGAPEQPPRLAAGALGPRLAGRLTAELILRSPQYMNPLKQYEIDLRGNKISTIENLGATENQFDSIDLSDNAIVRLEGFPRLLRLKTLLLNNNRITRIGKGCHEPIPNLELLVLTNNKLSNLQDLEPLAAFPNLAMLSLIGNPVVLKPNYRLFLISKCKALKVLDFKKVKQQEREEAVRLFPTDEAAAAHSAKTFEVDADYEAATGATAAGAAGSARPEPARPAANADGQAPAGGKKGPTPEQLVAIKAAIANAATMEEIRRLEAALVSGHLPSEIVLATEAQAPAAAASEEAKPAGGGDTEMTDAAGLGEGGSQANGGGQGAGQANGGGGDAHGKPDDMAVG